jgi:hypothetical protein
VSVPARPTPPARRDDVVGRLVALGVPERLLGGGFAQEVAASGTYAALTRTLATRLPTPPELPTGPGEVLLVVGPGVETLRAARSLAVSLRLDPDRVQWASRGDLAGLAPKGSRITTIEAAIDRRQEATTAGTVTIVAVDAPLRTDAYWITQMLAVWTPSAVWAVVEATRKPEDLEPWLGGLPRVDALIVQDTDLSVDGAGARGHPGRGARRCRGDPAPVGLPAVRATGEPAGMNPFRWDVLAVAFVLALPVLALGLRGDLTADEVTARLPWCLAAGWGAVALIRFASTPPSAPAKQKPARATEAATEQPADEESPAA